MVGSAPKDLSAMNTMALPCVAEDFNVLACDRDVVEYCEAHQNDILVIGGGSNLILPPRISSPVVQLHYDFINVRQRDDDAIVIAVGASVVWDELVAWSVDQGYFGLENLSLIPGSVGAAPVQNIGAYGVELKDSLVSVRAFDRQQKQFVELTNEQCHFAYRDSVFKQNTGRFIITEVLLRLSKTPSYTLEYGELKTLADNNALSGQLVRDKVIAVRSAKLPDPNDIPNTGSFFKNPVVPQETYEKLRAEHASLVAYPQAGGSYKIAAGWLIDQAGLKGYSVGGASVHTKQALVLINQGQAAQDDILQLASDIQSKIRSQYGVELEIEPVVIR